MSSRTVDKLQQQLRDEVFHYAQDSKKAAGRALGTIIEIITYYKLCAWKLSKHILIEQSIPEFGRVDIRHNVEFSLHKVIKENSITIKANGKAIRGKSLGIAGNFIVNRLTQELISSKSLLRNSAVVSDHENHVVVANLTSATETHMDVLVADLNRTPVAIFECKRVGVEEGMKKGPQSIEKAKQGAYVARSVSALQKVINRDGQVLGFLPSVGNQAPFVGNYDDMLDEIVTGKIASPAGFVLTVGVVSNHGNWFTSSNMNKELKVLAAAYDWLLFLTDEGLMEFVEDCILQPIPGCEPIRQAFTDSYNGVKGGNRFTKTRLDLEADKALRTYFSTNLEKSDAWFNVITPLSHDLPSLSRQIQALLR